jgi:hypothetical protein
VLLLLLLLLLAYPKRAGRTRVWLEHLKGRDGVRRKERSYRKGQQKKRPRRESCHLGSICSPPLSCIIICAISGCHYQLRSIAMLRNLLFVFYSLLLAVFEKGHLLFAV